MSYFIGHDLGTGGNKAVLIDAHGRILATSFASYGLSHPHPGWAEQDPAAWWEAVATCTRALVRDASVPVSDVAAIGFAGQMLALVPMRADGTPTRPAISWLDHRADAEAKRMIRRLGGKLVVSFLAGALPTGKDIVAKIAWLRAHEPAVFAATDAFGDATSYLMARASGQLVLDHTGAAATGLLDAQTRDWSQLLARLCSMPLAKFPPLRRCAEVLAPLKAEIAAELALTPGTAVTVGMSDIPSAALGSGAVDEGDAHIYLGTSSWLGVTVATPRNLPGSGIASVAGPDPRSCLMIAESETAGACIDWYRRILGCDYAQFEAHAAEAAPGAAGLLFLPWLFGERSPVPDASLRGAFANLSLEHGREHMARAIYEGVAFNLRWILDAVEDDGLRCSSLRAIGGGARSDLWLQTIADITSRTIARVAAPQHAGAVGCALASAVAVGALPSLAAIKQHVTIERSFTANPAHRPLYDQQYARFRGLYPALSKLGSSATR